MATECARDRGGPTSKSPLVASASRWATRPDSAVDINGRAICITVYWHNHLIPQDFSYIFLQNARAGLFIQPL